MIQKDRLKKYASLSSRLSLMSHLELIKAFRKTEVSRGWGVNHILHLGREKVFVKRIPLTQIEFENSFSTKNRFRLPLCYNYGVGSAGFGAFRELLMHIKTTRWVLGGENENFPLMYHYRILPKIDPNPPVDRKKHHKYIKYWGGNKNIDSYVLARKRASYEIVLFLEYIPFVANTWILKNTNKWSILNEGVKKTTDFLQTKGVIHFDLHLGNILTDGRRAYVTDFGLCLDRSFELSVAEQRTFRRHLNYDYEAFLVSLGHVLPEMCRKLSKRRQQNLRAQLGIPEEASAQDSFAGLIENTAEIKKLKALAADGTFLDFIGKNRKIILRMNSFFSNLRKSAKKQIRYQNK